MPLGRVMGAVTMMEHKALSSDGVTNDLKDQKTARPRKLQDQKIQDQTGQKSKSNDRLGSLSKTSDKSSSLWVARKILTSQGILRLNQR